MLQFTPGIAPWPSQDVIWRDDFAPPSIRIATLRKEISKGLSHIVREVMIRDKHSTRENRAQSRDHAESVIAQTKQEFDYLRDCGIAVAPTEWFVAIDRTESVRTLARVAIIEGYDMEEYRWDVPLSEDEQERYYELQEKIGNYLKVGEQGSRLADVCYLRQYRYGTPRDENLGLTSQAAYLVDIEPVYI